MSKNQLVGLEGHKQLVYRDPYFVVTQRAALSLYHAGGLPA